MHPLNFLKGLNPSDQVVELLPGLKNSLEEGQRHLLSFLKSLSLRNQKLKLTQNPKKVEQRKEREKERKKEKEEENLITRLQEDITNEAKGKPQHLTLAEQILEDENTSVAPPPPSQLHMSLPENTTSTFTTEKAGDLLNKEEILVPLSSQLGSMKLDIYKSSSESSSDSNSLDTSESIEQLNKLDTSVNESEETDESEEMKESEEIDESEEMKESEEIDDSEDMNSESQSSKVLELLNGCLKQIEAIFDLMMKYLMQPLLPLFLLKEMLKGIHTTNELSTYRHVNNLMHG
ncbi:hypothetical protein BDQ17DRAFT_1329044 [Cyathus striatus]|nr:hypothetical protein BDQ17DRAFT_1329044 [Cyathus striatus]